MRIVGRVNFIPQTKIRQMIDVYPVSQRYCNGILAKPDAQNDLSKAQLSYFLGNVIVPDQNAMWC
jgi:hypothetical protein